jgi:CheY-like chemotaxis protein
MNKGTDDGVVVRSPVVAYGVGVVALIAAILLRWLLDPLMGDTLPLVTLFGAVAAAVWLGGYRPALLVMILGYLVCAYVFIEPRGSLGLDEVRNLVGLSAYLVTCSIIIGFGEALRHARHRAEVRREFLRVTVSSVGDAVIYLHADLVRLAQVFSNLLNNACKYTEPGGQIWLTVERRGSDAIVKIKDTGVGIPPDQLGKIFEMFAQIDRTIDRSQGGLGIGLTVVRRLVEMHGGSVEAFSEGAGRGSEFVVRLLVLTDEPKVDSQKPIAEPTPMAQRRILVVDDNTDAASSLAMLLRVTGNQTYTAHDGLEAVEAAERVRPDVALLDIGLPKLNGYEACRRIREQPWGKKLVLVALTGWGQEEDRRKSTEAGFDVHMVKPVDYAALMTLLAEKLAKQP